MPLFPVFVAKWDKSGIMKVLLRVTEQFTDRVLSHNKFGMAHTSQ